jgi:hypothetical protein
VERRTRALPGKAEPALNIAPSGAVRCAATAPNRAEDPRRGVDKPQPAGYFHPYCMTSTGIYGLIMSNLVAWIVRAHHWPSTSDRWTLCGQDGGWQEGDYSRRAVVGTTNSGAPKQREVDHESDTESRAI